MFRSRSSEFSVAWEPPPWWRVLSFRGWSLLFLAVFSTVSFVGGLLSGEVLLLLSIRQKRGPIEASYQTSPIEFAACMALNLVIAVALWWLFVAWLRSRRRAVAQGFRSGAQRTGQVETSRQGRLDDSLR